MFPYMDLKIFRNKPLKVTELTDNFLRVGCLTRSKPASFLNDVTMITARAYRFTVALFVNFLKSSYKIYTAMLRSPSSLTGFDKLPTKFIFR